MLCERGCLPAAWLAKGGLRLRSSLTYSLDLCLYLSSSLALHPLYASFSFVPSLSYPLSVELLLVLSSLLLHLASSISLSRSFHLRVLLSSSCRSCRFSLVTTFSPTEPPTLRLCNDVNSHAHVSSNPTTRAIYGLTPGVARVSSPPKSNASSSSAGVPLWETIFLPCNYRIHLIK